MMEFLKIISLQEARRLLAQSVPAPEKGTRPLLQTLNHLLAEDLYSPEDVPGFDRSTVDGYAVKAGDTFGSSESLPGILELQGEVIMGRKATVEIQPGQCAWIPTGGMLPAGTDAVIMVEYTEKIGEDTILLYRPVGVGENIMLQGEDIEIGQTVFPRGKKIRPQDIGLLASLGYKEIPEYEPLKAGLISTGDEVLPIEQVPGPGQVRDVNSYSLGAAVKLCNAVPTIYPIVLDRFQDLQSAIEKALVENDLVLVSGGSSIGTLDLTLKVLSSFAGSELLFHGIAVRPGKPTLLARIGQKPVLGLPGHPVSALMVFQVLCAPLLRMQEPVSLYGELTLNVASQAGRDDFVAAKVLRDRQCGILVEPLLGKSGLMNILARADGYIHISSEKQGLSRGDPVKVDLFDL